jgi:hypothetical protein
MEKHSSVHDHKTTNEERSNEIPNNKYRDDKGLQRDRTLERERDWKSWTESVCNCHTFNKHLVVKIIFLKNLIFL